MLGLRRRWFSFSLRAFFTVLTLLCVWLGWNVERDRKQREVVAAVLELKGEVIFDRPPEKLYDLFYGPPKAIEVNLISRSASDATVRQLRCLTSLRRLKMRGAYVTDAGMVDLGAMTSLESLELFYPFITDEGLGHLAQLTRLRKLTVTDARITDEGLKALLALKDLKELTLANVPVTTVGTNLLQSLPKLVSLNVSGSKVSGRRRRSANKLN